MRITLKLWGYFTKLLPAGAVGYAIDIDVPDNASAREITELHNIPFADCRLMLLNGIVHTEPEKWGKIRLKDGDTLAILPNIH